MFTLSRFSSSVHMFSSIHVELYAANYNFHNSSRAPLCTSEKPIIGFESKFVHVIIFVKAIRVISTPLGQKNFSIV